MIIKRLLVGNKVKLTSFKEEYIPTLETWYNDTAFLRLFDVVSAFPKSKNQLQEMISTVQDSASNYIFAVRAIEEDKLIGVTGFENILWNNGTAVVYIGIGDESYRGQGIGLEALGLTLEFGFQELNLHRIQLTVLSYNKPAITLYEKLGFKREGIYREFIHRDGKRHDMYLYGILRNEWNLLNKEKVYADI